MYNKLKQLILEASKEAADYKKLVRSTQARGLEQGTDEFDMAHARILRAQGKVPTSKKRNSKRSKSNDYHNQWLSRLIRRKKPT